MSFIDRFDFADGRMYQHSAGQDMFKEGEQKKYLLHALSSRDFEYDFFISLLWGFADEKIIDFGYHPKGSKNDWFSNFEPETLVYKNGIWEITSTFTCEEGWILLGQEGINRRQTQNLEEFAKRPLELDFINPLLEFKL